MPAEQLGQRRIVPPGRAAKEALVIDRFLGHGRYLLSVRCALTIIHPHPGVRCRAYDRDHFARPQT
jgi:hypothetical protein